MSYTWHKAEREHTKLSHGVRKLNNTEDVSKWKSELEIANSKLANNIKDCLVFHSGGTYRMFLSLCSYFKYSRKRLIFVSFFPNSQMLQ